ncbi:MAG: hypothetical protein ACYC3Q_09325 [Gemmatimonadaceae bacterium]
MKRIVAGAREVPCAGDGSLHAFFIRFMSVEQFGGESEQPLHPLDPIHRQFDPAVRPEQTGRVVRVTLD